MDDGDKFCAEGDSRAVRRSDLKRGYKDNPPLAGIFKITNKVSGKVYVDKGLNVNGVMNRHEFQLRNGSHKNAQLQRDWNTLGAESFAFEVVDTLKPPDDPAVDINNELDELEKVWVGEIKPIYNAG